MRKILYSLRHILSILALPGVVLGVIPAALLSTTLSRQFAWLQPGPWNLLQLAAGGVLAAVGLTLMVSTISLFVRNGRGTLAPWDPPKHLVVEGIYRHVRNPMISGVLLVLLGEAVLTGSLAVLIFWLAAVLLNAVYIPLSEEPGLERRFGNEYRAYRRNVPRWIPRWKAWDGSG
jgi:protein-S-isoprenylcysteine O-methyltransferase Ste14